MINYIYIFLKQSSRANHVDDQLVLREIQSNDFVEIDTCTYIGFISLQPELSMVIVISHKFLLVNQILENLADLTS